MQTTLGRITIALNRAQAPISVKNFLLYVRGGFYDGTLFHRVKRGFMIQGGGYGQDFAALPTRGAIKNEAANGLLNKRGTIAMARTNAPDSATSQFFINVVDNRFLDPNSRSAGYAVFGEVLEGMDVVYRIAASPTRFKNELFADLPVTPVVIKSVREAPAPKPRPAPQPLASPSASSLP
jgi:cyclophilin family peptidyl-prolyl cis-trans isomerase